MNLQHRRALRIPVRTFRNTVYQLLHAPTPRTRVLLLLPSQHTCLDDIKRLTWRSASIIFASRVFAITYDAQEATTY